MESTFDLLRTDIAIDIGLIDLIYRLTVGMILATIIVIHYNNNSQCLSERGHFSRVFPFILMTTLLVITIVKSSLALSLGLVGALSIVRFRTPIKEPEDLAYLFICIAAGVGIGAGAVAATAMSVVFILTGATIFFKITNKNMFVPHYLSVSQENSSEKIDLDDVLNIISKRTVDRPRIRRIDYFPDSIDGLIHLSLSQDASIAELLSELQSKWPNAQFSIMDQSRTPIS
jgi:hypothetical protein